MNYKEEQELKLEIDHIFESGANEIRIFEMVKNFIDRMPNQPATLEVKDNLRIEIATQIMAGFTTKGTMPSKLNIDHAFELADAIIERGKAK